MVAIKGKTGVYQHKPMKEATRKKISDKLRGRHVSPNSEQRCGKDNINWKGNKVGYSALHEWIRLHKPKSMFCECCGKITPKLEASNISGQYLRDISDFRWLCVPCHRRYDAVKKGGYND